MSKNKTMIKYSIAILSALALVASFIFFITAPSSVDAGDQHNISGWAWSGDVNNGGAGWISFNSENDPTTSANYGVNVDAEGDFSGYAWSDVIGWINFNNNDCGSAPALDFDTGDVTGWAKAMLDYTGGGSDYSFANGWNGCIELSGTNHETGVTDGSGGVTYIPEDQKFVGYAWSDDIGWIDFAPEGGFGGVLFDQDPLNVSCSGNPSNSYPDETITWTAAVEGGSGSYTYDWLGDVSGTSQVVSTSYSSVGTYNAQVEVTSGFQTQTATCSSVTIGEEEEGLSCSVRASAFINQDVVWEYSVTGGLTYDSASWSGHSEIEGQTSDSVTVSYSDPGIKSGTVTLSFEGNPVATCSSSTRIGHRPSFEEF